MIPKRAIVIGSGASILDGKTSTSEIKVWDKIQSELTIGINWCFMYFIPTISLFGDYHFYIKEIERLSKLPLVFGMQDAYYTRSKVSEKINTETFHLHDNIYMLPNRMPEETEDGKKEYFGVDAWKKGFYSRYLSGILGINLAVALGCTEIYLLGFDGCATNGKTHFYQGEFKACHVSEEGKERSGVGLKADGKYKTSVYNQNFGLKFEPFKNDKAQIYNVSEQSNLHVFPKISYDTLYSKLDETNLNQSVLRKNILTLYKSHYMETK